MNIISKMDYKKANKELREHINLLLEHFDNDDEAGWNKLMNSQYFKDAMVHSYKNKGGTLETSTRNWLRNSFKGGPGSKGLTLPQINKIQDTMWGFMYAGYAIHGEDVLSERTGNKALDAYNDARVMFGR